LVVLPEIQTTNLWIDIAKNEDGHFNWIFQAGGQLSMASTRHWVTCGSKPGVGRNFFPSLAFF